MISNLIGAAVLLAYYLGVCFLLPTAVNAWVNVPTELVRKIQHISYSMSIFLLLRLFSTWYWAIIAAFVLVIVAYPALMLIERSSIYKRLFVDRESAGGELRMQLLYVQISFAVLIFIFWGLLGTAWHYIVAVAVMAWGFGDAAAALIGKAFGRHRVIHKLIEGAKTYEGTIAMIVTAGLALFLTLVFYGNQPWHVSLIVSMIVAPVCGIVELFSRKGTDTLTVPITAAVMMLPILHLCSLLGW